MRILIPVITKAHGVSCNIGIAYTVPSYSVSKVLHNCFQIVNFGDIRDIEVQTRHFLISVCYTKENKFPKRTEAESKKNQPRETITRDNLGSTTFHTSKQKRADASADICTPFALLAFQFTFKWP
jgi:hypothetical protein